MLGRLKASWHKARALSALQVYFDQPLKEPLPAEAEESLRRHTRRSLEDGGTPIDTAARYFCELAAGKVGAGETLDEINFFGVVGRVFGLRDQMTFYREHHNALLQIGKSEEAEAK